MPEIAKEFILAEIRSAEERLEAAKHLLEEGFLSDAVSRAYYAAYFAARAVINALGHDVKTHAGLVSQFGILAVKAGIMPREYGITLRRAYEMRESAEYQVLAEFEKREVENLLHDVERFVSEARKTVYKLIEG